MRGRDVIGRLATTTTPAGGVAPAPRSRLLGGLAAAGELFALAGDTLAVLVTDLARRRFQWREFVTQAWFIAAVCMLPAVLVAVPFGVVTALQVGGVARQIGAGAFTGAANGLTVVREAAPVVTALLLAGAGGSAICADLGARRIRDEIDAMEVMGISPVQRLVAPRLLAAMVVAVLLNGVVAFVGVAGGYAYTVLAQHEPSGSYLASLTTLVGLPDLLVAEAKAATFGAIAAVVAAYKGLGAKGGPKGVGDAVNQSVVVTFLLLFLVNFLITGVYFAVVPQRIS